MNILKVSYHNLGLPLKNCFASCALFPKDYVFDKEMLINLWVTEGFIAPAIDDFHSVEELGEEYFLTLLQRGFFQNVKMDEWGRIESCKMHDCMHDLAQQVAGVKYKVVNPNDDHYQNNIRHLSIAHRLNFQNTIPPAILSLKVLRTILLPQQLSDGSTFSQDTCQKIISSFSCLRVLDLHDLGLTNVPASIGKLIHLRYLDLSLNPIRSLPDSITELHNVQTLKLFCCTYLLALPTKIEKLVNLRILDVSDCYKCEMPSGIGELNLLHKLPLLTITSKKSTKLRNKLTHTVKLSDLKKLNNLRGKLCIAFKDFWNTERQETKNTLTSKHGLTELEIDFYNTGNGWEVVLEGMKPHPNLRKLKIIKYKGQKLPSWGMKDSLLNNLPKLVEIRLFDWDYCQEVPNFGQLPLLKCLSLKFLEKVEYMEMENDVHDASSSIISTLFFPSLETLELSWMSSLKGWRIEVDGSSELSLSFPKLSNLTIHECPNFAFLPNCPNVENLHLVHTGKSLSVSKMVTTTSAKLKELRIDNVDELLSIPKQCLIQLSSLNIQDDELVGTENLREVFTTLSISLRSLEFRHCRRLISIQKGLEHLASLEEFVLRYTWLPFREDEEKTWKALKTSLRTLRLEQCHNLLCLPRGFQHLTNLRTLKLSSNSQFKELPKWIDCFSSLQCLELRDCTGLTYLPEEFQLLTSLQELQIIECGPDLTERCRGPNGKDWPKIQHIPFVAIKN